MTGTSFTSQDALASAEARLTVMMAPERVEILRDHELVEAGELSVREGAEEVLVCVTRLSNPAPRVSWLLGDTRLQAVEQTNVTEREVEDIVITISSFSIFIIRWRTGGEARPCSDTGSVLRTQARG